MEDLSSNARDVSLKAIRILVGHSAASCMPTAASSPVTSGDGFVDESLGLLLASLDKWRDRGTSR